MLPEFRSPRRGRSSPLLFRIAIVVGLIAAALLAVGLQWLRTGRIELWTVILAEVLFVLLVLLVRAWRSG